VVSSRLLITGDYTKDEPGEYPSIFSANKLVEATGSATKILAHL
jgi:hypothetical protein